MELYHLHILQRNPRPVGESHAIARLDPTVCCELEDPAATSCGQDDSLGQNRRHLPRPHVDRSYTGCASIFNKQRCRKPLVIPVDVLMLQGGLEECVKHVEYNLVPGEQGSFDTHATEGSAAYPCDWRASLAATRSREDFHLQAS